MALCTATATGVSVFSFDSENWQPLDKPNQFTMKLFDGGNHHILKFYTAQKELLQLKLKTTTTIQRHMDSHPKCCEVNHENSIYLLRFDKESACEVFVTAVSKAIAKEKDKTMNKKGVTAMPGSQPFDGGYEAQMHGRPRLSHETAGSVYGSGQDVGYRPAPQLRSEWSSGENLPGPYRHGEGNLPSPHTQGDSLPSPHRQRPLPNAFANYPRQEPAMQYVDYHQEQPPTRSAGYPEQPAPRQHAASPPQDAYATGQSSRQFNRGVSEAEKAIQGSMSAGDLNLWLSELTIAVNANNGTRAYQMVDRLMQYPKHVGQVALSGTCQEKKKELPCDSSEDCIRLQVTVESQQSTSPPAIIIVHASRKWKVKDLKLEVEHSNLLPREVQKWIIGKRLARDEDLVDNLVGGAPDAEVFMYVVKARKGNLDRINYDSYRDKMEHQQQEQDDHRVEKEKEGPARTPHGAVDMFRDLPPPAPSKVHAAQSPLPVAKPRRAAPPGPEPGSEKSDSGSRPIIFGIDVPVASPEAGPVGWACPTCTFVNKPARPGCEICSAARPADYQPPLDYQFDDSEKELMRKLDQDEESMRRNIEEERRRREEERVKNFQALQATDFKDIIENTEAFGCSVCLEDIEPGEGVILRECLHMFCKDCLRGSIVNSEDAEVTCPFADYPCGSIITEREIRGVLTEEEFEKFEHRGIAKAEAVMADSFHCVTTDCPGWCVYEDDVNHFPCPICNKTNCLTCKAIHEGMNCKEYQDDLARKAANDEAARATKEFLEQMLTKGDAMRCSQCGVIVQKKEGCDWIKCSVCKTELCWATKGPRWGPKGRGDISGGCKCGVNRQKCTPRCGNCH